MSTLQLLLEEEAGAPGSPGLACRGLFGFVWAREEEGREEGEGASSSWGSKGIKVVAVVIDGCLSRVMPWDLRAVGVGDPLPFLPS